MFKVGLTRLTLTTALRQVPQAQAVFASRWATPFSLQLVRWNSTQPSSLSEIRTELTNFDDSTTLVELSTSDLHSDQIGYLSSVGLGDGWGPTSWICNLLEHVYVYSGLPWWATIAVSTVAVRAVMLPLYVKSSANMAKMSKIKPQVDALMNKVKVGDPKERIKALAERKSLFEKYDIKTLHGFFPLLQLPIAYGFFQALRSMANVPVEGFSIQGTHWFQNLAAVDPYLGLQILTACVVTGMMKLGGETGAHAMNPLMKKVMMYLPFLSIFVTYNMSAAVLVYFATNSVFSLLQSIVLRNKLFRRMVNIPQIEAPVPVPGATPPPTTLSEWWRQWNHQMKEEAEKKKQSELMMNKAQKRIRNHNENFIKRH